MESPTDVPEPLTTQDIDNKPLSFDCGAEAVQAPEQQVIDITNASEEDKQSGNRTPKRPAGASPFANTVTPERPTRPENLESPVGLKDLPTPERASWLLSRLAGSMHQPEVQGRLRKMMAEKFEQQKSADPMSSSVEPAQLRYPAEFPPQIFADLCVCWNQGTLGYMPTVDTIQRPAICLMRGQTRPPTS